MRPDGVLTLPRISFAFSAMVQPLLIPLAERYASLSLVEHSSQHTSTVLPPILTSIAFSSRLQSQAAHVFTAMILLQSGNRSFYMISRPLMNEKLLSRSLAIFRLWSLGFSEYAGRVQCEMLRSKRVQEVTRVECLACSDDTPCLYC